MGSYSPAELTATCHCLPSLSLSSLSSLSSRRLLRPTTMTGRTVGEFTTTTATARRGIPGATRDMPEQAMTAGAPPTGTMTTGTTTTGTTDMPGTGTMTDITTR